MLQISAWYKCIFFSNGANTSEYIVPSDDNSAAGSYTCQVNISAALSSDSPAYVLTATGDRMIRISATHFVSGQ